MTTQQTPGSLVREIRQYLGANVHLCGVEDSMLDDAALDLARLVLGADRQPAKCEACQGSGIVGHSDICPCCRDTWKPAEPTVRECRSVAGFTELGELLDAAHAAVEILDDMQDDPTARRASVRLSYAAAALAHQPADPDAQRWRALRHAAATNDEDFLWRVIEALADDRTPTEDEIDAAVDAAMEDSHA